MPSSSTSRSRAVEYSSNASALCPAADKARILSAGISEAMNCTAFGLLTAIPALLAFSLLNGRIQHMMDDINESTVGVLNLIVANREKIRMPSADMRQTG